MDRAGDRALPGPLNPDSLLVIVAKVFAIGKNFDHEPLIDLPTDSPPKYHHELVTSIYVKFQRLHDHERNEVMNTLLTRAGATRSRQRLKADASGRGRRQSGRG